MSAPFIETDCTIEHNGRTYTSGGAVITEGRVIAYVGPDQTHGNPGNLVYGREIFGILTTWHGEPIGRWRLISQWTQRTPCTRDGYTERYPMRSIRALIDGRIYHGRYSPERGNVVFLRATKHQPTEKGA